MPLRKSKVMGVGSPIVDLLAEVDDAFIDTIEGDKGGMVLVNEEQMQAMEGRVPGELVQAPGGSAANTIFALAKLGMPAAFLGKLGDDEYARYYADAFTELGGDPSRFKHEPSARTARCLSLVTPDGERTMRTELAAAGTMADADVSDSDFDEDMLVHLEGYLLFNPDLTKRVLDAAKAAGSTISLDLGSFEVVGAAGDSLQGILENYVDIVFANEDEAAAYTGTPDPDLALDRLGTCCNVAAVKLGAEGALLKHGGEQTRVRAMKVDKVIDTTGAGDMWAAGFLYGYLNGLPLEACGRMGSILGAELVQHMGVELLPESWDRVRAAYDELLGAHKTA